MLNKKIERSGKNVHAADLCFEATERQKKMNPTISSWIHATMNTQLNMAMWESE